MRAARPLALADTSMPAFAIDTDAPLMALVGVLRPRLLITRPVLEALTDEELQRERRARARPLARAGTTSSGSRCARRPICCSPRAPRARSSGAGRRRPSSVADRGAGDSGRARCALASALVKVARLTPPVSSVAEPISALVDGGDITSRVQRLLDDAPSDRARRARCAGLPLAIPVAALALGYTPLLRIVHAVTEILVNSLP